MYVLRPPNALRRLSFGVLAAAVALLPIAPTAASAFQSGHDLSIVLATDEDMVATGGRFTVTMTVENAGPLPAADAFVSTATPEGTTFLSVMTSGGVVASAPGAGATGPVTVHFPAFDVDEIETVELELFVTAQPGTQITTTANVEPQAQSGDQNQSNNTDDITVQVVPAGTADIAVDVSPDDETAGSGSLFGYTITVSNESTAGAARRDTATGVFAVTSVPDGAVFSSLSLSQGDAETPGVGEAGDILISLGNLAAGESAEIDLVVEVQADPGETLSLSFESSSDANDPDTSNNTADVDVDVVASEPAMLEWDPPEPPTDAEPFPPPEHLVVSEGSGAIVRPRAAGVATSGTVTGYNVYRSNKPGVAPMPGNLFTSVPASQTSTGAPVAPGGSFFTVTAQYGNGESAPSNEASASIPAATVTKVKVKSTKITATGTGFTPAVTVFIDGIPFATGASVKKNNTKVVQKGNLLTGQTIGAYLAAHPSVLLSFRNSNGGVASLRYPTP